MTAVMAAFFMIHRRRRVRGRRPYNLRDEPTSGPVGTVVTITGSGFSGATSANSGMAFTCQARVIGSKRDGSRS